MKILSFLFVQIVLTHWIAAQDFERREGFVRVEGGSIWYKVIGSGKGTPLLLIHGGPGGPGGPGGGRFGPPMPGQVLPVFLQEQLNLTDEQKKKIESLQKEVDSQLAKILTDEQKKQMQEMRDRGPGGPGGRFGPGGPGGAPGGPPKKKDD